MILSILADIDNLGWIWSDAIRYLQEKAPATRDARYRKLCDQPRIAQELEKLRRKAKQAETGNDALDE